MDGPLALIFASTKPQYDDRLFIELPNLMFSPCSEIRIYWTCKSMNNCLSYCGLVDARISASEKDLPVRNGDFLSFFDIGNGNNFKRTISLKNM